MSAQQSDATTFHSTPDGEFVQNGMPTTRFDVVHDARLVQQTRMPAAQECGQFDSKHARPARTERGQYVGQFDSFVAQNGAHVAHFDLTHYDLL
ncbi:hypothetical protein AURDEDRAFT_165602, partial [Auricularia subglabra TFB-10046 SS5]